MKPDIALTAVKAVTVSRSKVQLPKVDVWGRLGCRCDTTRSRQSDQQCMHRGSTPSDLSPQIPQADIEQVSLIVFVSISAFLSSRMKFPVT